VTPPPGTASAVISPLDTADATTSSNGRAGVADAAETRWLNANQLHAWRSFLLAYARVVQHLNDDMQATSDMPLTWYDVLVHLSEAPDGTLCMTDLAESVFISRSGLTRLVDRMEQGGLVKRSPAPDDRRRMMASLTDEGFRRLTEAAPGHVEALRTVMIDLLDDDDISSLATVMDKITAPIPASALP
jgi:DNA-binding MarR family transcriptional regulator